jgi:hypothetical protein
MYCKECRWWEQENADVGRCTDPTAYKKVASPLHFVLRTFLDFGCVHFEEKGKIPERTIKDIMRARGYRLVTQKIESNPTGKYWINFDNMREEIIRDIKAGN